MIEQVISSSTLPPGLAAKLYGTCNFLEQGMYGRVGTGGLRAIRERLTKMAMNLPRRSLPISI